MIECLQVSQKGTSLLENLKTNNRLSQALMRYAFSMEEPKVPAAKRKFSPPPSLSPPRRTKEKLASLSSASEDEGAGPSTSSTASTSKKILKQVGVDQVYWIGDTLYVFL